MHKFSFSEIEQEIEDTEASMLISVKSLLQSLASQSLGEVEELDSLAAIEAY